MGEAALGTSWPELLLFSTVPSSGPGVRVFPVLFPTGLWAPGPALDPPQQHLYVPSWPDLSWGGGQHGTLGLVTAAAPPSLD